MATISEGYTPTFLTVDLPLPEPADPGAIVRLDYVHFTVLLERSRRLALATAVNIDGDRLLDLGREDDWHFDPRVSERDQAGPEIYARNALDRGHLVRRRDPVWGTVEDATEANYATFSFTNAAPQAALFNQGPALWVGLEDHVLGYAEAHEQKLSVFTGPVLADSDPEYRGLQVPRQFWKIAAWTSFDTADPARAQRLNAAGFVLDQSRQLDVILRGETLADPPPIGPYLTYQVPISSIAELSGLAITQLEAADVLEPSPDWRRVRRPEDLTLRAA